MLFTLFFVIRQLFIRFERVNDESHSFFALKCVIFESRIPPKYTGARGIFEDFCGGGATPPWSAHEVLYL